MTIKPVFAAAIVAGAIVFSFGAAPGAQAAPAAVDRSPAKVAATPPVRPVADIENEDEAANCSKSRKRLWVEGEGWVVRKVTICR